MDNASHPDDFQPPPQRSPDPSQKLREERQRLSEERQRLLNKRRILDWIRAFLWISVFLAAAVFIWEFVSSLNTPGNLTVTNVVGFGFIVMVAFIYMCIFDRLLLEKPTNEDILQLADEIDLLEEDEPEWRRAEKLFKLHQHELKRYYDEALTKFQKLFWVGVVSLALGFVIVFVTYELITDSHITDSSQKTIVVALGVLASLLSNFIGATYVKMYGESIKSLTTFHNRLVTTHHMHYGAYLASQITDRKLLNDTWSQMALGTLPKAAESESKSEKKATEEEGTSGNPIVNVFEKLFSAFTGKEKVDKKKVEDGKTE